MGSSEGMPWFALLACVALAFPSNCPEPSLWVLALGLGDSLPSPTWREWASSWVVLSCLPEPNHDIWAQITFLFFLFNLVSIHCLVLGNSLRACLGFGCFREQLKDLLLVTGMQVRTKSQNKVNRGRRPIPYCLGNELLDRRCKGEDKIDMWQPEFRLTDKQQWEKLSSKCRKKCSGTRIL